MFVGDVIFCSVLFTAMRWLTFSYEMFSPRLGIVMQPVYRKQTLVAPAKSATVLGITALAFY
ncbi:hypothetical protein [Shewanella septentrionalis]|uniref:Uncharacterized protein n=1 Tax=Shewanella septentrionalis TaxID=2952223 RepID=A0A9X2WWP2_9GAMM|nr:hypothetical protein [Shewanella septentrionalis]MCT7947049.1 hypothetical protein [Shewanella septentrionalis]